MLRMSLAMFKILALLTTVSSCSKFLPSRLQETSLSGTGQPDKITIGGTTYTYDSRFKRWYHFTDPDWIRGSFGFSPDDFKTLAAGESLLRNHFLKKNFQSVILDWNYKGMTRRGFFRPKLHEIEIKNKNGIVIISETPRLVPISTNFKTTFSRYQYGGYDGVSFSDLVYQETFDTDSCKKKAASWSRS